MRLCECPRPIADTLTRDRLRCAGCGGWRPNGSPLSRVDFERWASEASDLLEASVTEYAWIPGQLYGLRSRGSGPTARGSHSDPTLVQVEDERRDRARGYAALAACLIKRVHNELRDLDDAVGETKLALSFGPRVKVDYVVREVVCGTCHGAGRVSVVPEGRVDLEAPHAAQRRRWARGDGVPL